MTNTRFLRIGMAALAIAAGLAALTSGARAQQAAAVTVDADDIGGVVSGPKGPEAGVWVIAETTDLPTKFVKIVVTDDRGRYLLPCCRTCPRRITPYGCAATASSIRRRSPRYPARC
jgi:hypothetical protein